MTEPPAPPRATQAERSARTRGLLLDAAVACLAEQGYAGTTTTEVARRAGVSRGAQLHHFPTRTDLLAAALEETFRRRMSDLTAALGEAPPGPERMRTAVDTLWTMFQRGECDAWLELAVAARHDPDLAERMRELNERHRRGVEELFATTIPPEARTGLLFEVGPKFLLAVLDGLALQRMSGYDDGPGRADGVIEGLKQLAAFAFPAG